MHLEFNNRAPEYTGQGGLPNGNYEETGEWLPVTRYLEAGAGQYPDKILFKCASNDGELPKGYTYKETNDTANRVANGLISEFGIKRGDKVALYMLNRDEYVFSIIATHKLGGVQVPINKDEKGERLSYIISYSESVVLIIDEGSVPFIEQISGELTTIKAIFVTAPQSELPGDIGGIKVYSFDYFDKFPTDNPGIPVTVSDTERCMFTSGTTGMPKGVVREHGGVVLTVRSYLQQQGIRSDDVLMSVLSLGHANAQVMGLFSAIGSGATVVFYPRFSASQFWKWAGECGANCVNMLGAVAEYLWAAAPSDWDRKHKVRIMLGSPAPRNLKEFEERFGVRVIDGYGSTEMGMVLWKDPEDTRMGSSGHGMQGYHLELRNPLSRDDLIEFDWDSQAEPTAPEDAKGLLFIKPLVPNTTLREYFKDPERTSEAFDKDGFFNSDDLFALGNDGRFYFQGRYTRIRVSGENVDPIAVQEMAMRYDPVQEAIAVGIRLPDIADDEIKLNVTVKKGQTFDPGEFCKWMADKVIMAMVPRFIEVYAEGFPMTTTQKIKVAAMKEISEGTWDRSKAGLKFSARK